ncbi:hypothetical protein BDR07DRAFT_1501597 [Suillus spraguei]|nr:hypothetical protein BDR07DRAFT_1501597 [Suillus spraguei]
MPRPQQNQAEDDSDFESNSHANEDSTDSDSTDLDEDLMQVRAAIVPARDGVTIQEVHQALEMAQNLLLNMFKGRWQKNLTAKDLALSAKEDTIRAHGHKYSMTHCLWINAEIFFLCSIEDGITAKLFKFISEIDLELMGYKNFTPHFAKGVSGIHSEMVSDIKSCTGAIFRLNSEFLFEATLTIPSQILFLHPEHPNKDEFLKTAKLVRVLKVALFRKSSLSTTYAPAPKTKGKLWQLWNTTPGMIAAAAVVAIFVLSGDKDLYVKGKKINIMYHQYHNYYHRRLMTGGAWARDILNFFNNGLFPKTSSSHVTPDMADMGTSHNSWEEELERAMEEGGDGPAFQFDPVIIAPVAQSSSVTCPSSAFVKLPAPTPVTTHTLLPVSATASVILRLPAPTIVAPSNSISSAMQDLTLVGKPDVVDAIPPKPKPKPRCNKAKADETGVEVRRSGCKK